MTDRGELAYQVFCRTTGQKEISFEDLPKLEQLAWANSAQCVVNDYLRDDEPDIDEQQEWADLPYGYDDEFERSDDFDF